jgi:predicted RNase H-like nuclease
MTSVTETKPQSRAVLGVDAAWAEAQPSGVALAVERSGGWFLAAVDASYGQFIDRANGIYASEKRPRGSKPNAAALLNAARKICGQDIDVVAVDMPIAHHQIEGRRACDQLISQTYGAKGAGTHTPSAERPGKISDALCAEFGAQGFGLCVRAPARGPFEVYPHPALIEFLNAPYRLEYKVSNRGKYWRELSERERRLKLVAVWAQIVAALEHSLEDVSVVLLPPAPDVSVWCLKTYEDKLDAVICAAAAIACLHGKATAFGDEDAAIWVPLNDSDQRR